MTEIREQLYDVSPYVDFDASEYPADLQGWGSDDPIISRLIEVVRPAKIVEVGTWKGRSAINMAKAVKEFGIACEIVCVDTWLGSVEHWDKTNHRDWYESLALHHGFPSLYYTFLANVVREGVADIITPFPTTSENAAHILNGTGIKFDMCYLDAAHEYSAVLRDLTMYWGILSADGVLLGDDYIFWPEVTRAANDFAIQNGIQIFGKNGKYIMQKSNKISIDIALSAS